MSQIFAELRRRNIFRVAGAYVVISWVLIQIAVAIEAPLSLPNWTDTLVITLLALGLPITLIFTWAFEITPEGVRRSSDSDDAAGDGNGRIADWALALTLLAFIGFFAWSRLVPDTATSAVASEGTAPSIAVLPFADMSPQKDQEYFSDGISEEILNVLAKTHGMKVAARTSSFAFKGRDQDIREIGRLLDVAHVLEGSVRKFGDRIRITAQLIRVDNGYHLWSETYDRDLRDIFAVQDEISAQIQHAMRLHLLGDVETPARAESEFLATDNMEAYDHFLRGKHLMAKRTGKDLEASAEEFRRAVELAPQFARAHSMLAINYMLLRQGFSTYGSLSSTEARELAQPHITVARALAPDLPELHAIEYFLSKDPKRALTGLNRAIELNPNYAEAIMWRALVQLNQGDNDEGFKGLEAARKVDPLSLVINGNLANIHARSGNLGEAQRAIESMRIVDPNSVRTLWAEVTVAMLSGDFESALLKGIRADRTGKLSLVQRYWLHDFLLGLDLPPSLIVSPGPDSDFWRAFEHWDNGELGLALAASKTYLEHNPNAPFAKTQLAALQVLNGNESIARQLFEEMIAKGNHRELPPCWTPLQMTLVKLNLRDQLDKTAELCAIMLAAPPDWEVAQRAFGFHAIRGNHDQAIAELTRSMELGAPMLSPIFAMALPFIEEHPELPAILGELEQRQKAERKRALLTLQQAYPDLYAKVQSRDATAATH